ncbi:hypothetical protein ASPWEDRAFT_567393 [Aspergillus wentii DTO 134E9]|uniref:Mating locus protein n=1 Tax=Aspergillus wentii DTO 134E9 TaxID=1073089 RepID=A0A1L9RH17_ASPWE|nr:uncharacterized protein ASPWEDRAFT_567393 [Aspergillus wentii DTO 134E9]OJJ34230.1 hypothetical protein ASPWEDRAFT_567393 [Aspergillus wentii DTO 134E9]
MDQYGNALLRYLGTMARDARFSSEQREQATYMAISFLTHKNTCRLMAQISALTSDEMTIYPSHRVGADDSESPVRRHGKYLQAIMTDFRIIPTIADFEGHPIELISILDPAIENSLKGEKKFRFHQELLSMEKKANDDLARCTKQYGYHYIFRAGLQQYYMTKAVVERINFWRPDHRGDEYRVHAQKLCYEAMEMRVILNTAEKRILVQATACLPDDALKFWKWLENNRVAYHAMKVCIAMLNNLN